MGVSVGYCLDYADWFIEVRELQLTKGGIIPLTWVLGLLRMETVSRAVGRLHSSPLLLTRAATSCFQFLP